MCFLCQLLPSELLCALLFCQANPRSSTKIQPGQFIPEAGLNALLPASTVLFLFPPGSRKEHTQASESDISGVRRQLLHLAVGVSLSYFASLSYHSITILVPLYFRCVILCHSRCSPQINSISSPRGLVRNAESQNLQAFPRPIRFCSSLKTVWFNYVSIECEFVEV